MNAIVTHPTVIIGSSIEKEIIDRPSGFITSNYKKVVTYNLEQPDPESLFAKRQVAKLRLWKNANSIEILLKVTIFVALLSIIL